MEKNVAVVDEFGNEYEATYPKRAKGLVKNGRARFVDENKICLACPPNKKLEDNKMEQTKVTEREIFEKIVELQNQLTGNSQNSLHRLGDTMDSLLREDGVAEGGALEIVVGRVCDIFAMREENLGNILKLYERMYEDAHKEREKKLDAVKSSFDHVMALMQSLELPPENSERVLLDVNEKISQFVSDIMNT